jgi:predicted metal-dependent phosphotriesterase family hydrolase
MDGETFDFGLADDEAFVPPIDPDDERLGDPHIMTALGPIEPGALGATILRGTILRTPPDGGPADARLDDPHVTLSELENAQYAGLTAMVDFTTTDDGLDAPGARWVAERTALHLVLATGSAHPAAPGADPATLAAGLVRDLTEGVAGTAARAGVIAIPADPAWIAAAAAAQATVLAPVAITVASPLQIDAALRSAALAGIDPARTILAGISGAWPREVLRRPLDAGSWLLVDQLAADWDADQTHVATIAALAQAGSTRVLVGCDLRRRAQWRAWNGQPGMGYLIDQFAVALMDHGLSGMDVRRLLVDAPNEALVSRHLAS